MRYVSTAEMRSIDAKLLQTTCRFPEIPESDALIKLASHGLVNLVLERCADAATRPPVHVVFGNGNNGADALYAGWELAAHGFPVKCYAAMTEDDAKGAVKAFSNSGRCPHLFWYSKACPWTAMPPSVIERGAVIIDGILGIGVHGAPREPAASAIRWINSLKGRAHLVSVDVPSGLDADSGTAEGDVVEADITVCMGLPKQGMSTSTALKQSGSVVVNDLEISDAMLSGDVSCNEMVTARDVAASIPRRVWNSHKGDYGHVCIIGGTQGYCGAPALAALGALKSGAGLVSALVPEAIAGIVASHAPEMMVFPLKSDGVTETSLVSSGFSLTGKTLVVGPGMSRKDGVSDAVTWLLEKSGAGGVVLDADALNALCGRVETLAACALPKILTPHPGEAARLLGITTAEVQADRPAALKRLVDLTGAAVILKGAGTLVSAPGRGVHLVAGVNPGMARGGMGDVLSGVAGALLARGLTAFDAARAAAWMHVRAGDVASWRNGRESMLATDVVSCLGK